MTACRSCAASDVAGVTVDISAGGGGTNIGDGTTISSIEQLVFDGGSGADTVTGGAMADVIVGNDGADILNGGGGDDFLYGGAGNDTIYSLDGQGADIIDGGDDIDTLHLNRGSSAIGLNVDISAGGGGLDIGDGTSIANIEVLDFTGGSGNDTVKGGGGADTLDGGAGTDTAVYTGNVSQYAITVNIDGSLTITDNRVGVSRWLRHGAEFRELPVCRWNLLVR